MADVAFLGLGVMGAPMAGHLLDSGARVAVWNRTLAKAAPFGAKGARVAESPADAARGAEAVFLCVGGTQDVEQVLFGEQGVAHGLESGATVVDCTTIAPDAEIGFADKIRRLGGRFLDAPVTGGQKGAVDGTLSFMVGGEEADLERVRPFLLAMGKRIFHVGPVGSGQKLKMVNQLCCAIHLLALGEAFAMVRRLGLDPVQSRELLISGAAESWALNVYGGKVIAGDYAPGFPLKWQAKDVRIALDAARALGLDLPALELAHRRLQEAMARGLGDEGSQAVVKLYG
jgi:3-hydroxyisobutyrate dehydrogenase